MLRADVKRAKTLVGRLCARRYATNRNLKLAFSNLADVEPKKCSIRVAAAGSRLSMAARRRRQRQDAASARRRRLLVAALIRDVSHCAHAINTAAVAAAVASRRQRWRLFADLTTTTATTRKHANFSCRRRRQRRRRRACARAPALPAYKSNEAKRSSSNTRRVFVVCTPQAAHFVYFYTAENSKNSHYTLVAACQSGNFWQRSALILFVWSQTEMTYFSHVSHSFSSANISQQQF